MGEVGSRLRVTNAWEIVAGQTDRAATPRRAHCFHNAAEFTRSLSVDCVARFARCALPSPHMEGSNDFSKNCFWRSGASGYNPIIDAH